MDLDALELVQAVDVGPAQTAEDSDAGEEEVRNVLELLELALLLGGTLDGEVPLAGLLVVTSSLELVPELDVRPELVLLSGVLEVLEDLWAGSVEGGPVGLQTRGERCFGHCMKMSYVLVKAELVLYGIVSIQGRKRRTARSLNVQQVPAYRKRDHCILR